MGLFNQSEKTEFTGFLNAWSCEKDARTITYSLSGLLIKPDILEIDVDRFDRRLDRRLDLFEGPTERDEFGGLVFGTLCRYEETGQSQLWRATRLPMRSTKILQVGIETGAGCFASFVLDGSLSGINTQLGDRIASKLVNNRIGMNTSPSSFTSRFRRAYPVSRKCPRCSRNARSVRADVLAELSFIPNRLPQHDPQK